MKESDRDIAETAPTAPGSVDLCVSVIAEMKNLAVSPADCRIIAERVVSRTTPEQLAAYFENSPRTRCAVMEEANAELDQMAALHVVRIFAEVGNAPALSDKTANALVKEILSGLPPRGEAIYRWPGRLHWEQMAATRFGVSTPTECRFPPRSDPGFPLRTDPGG